MPYSDKRVYIAAPFFNSEQLSLVQSLESSLSSLGLNVFSPRLHGVTIKDLPEEEREEAAKEAFDMNVKGLWESNVLLHVLDGKDLGAAWECGFWCGTYGPKNPNCPILIYQSGDKPLNIMMQQVALGFTTSLGDTLGWFKELCSANVYKAAAKYGNFSKNLT